jgi:vanillate monooxygenase ferredoxin subunit
MLEVKLLSTRVIAEDVRVFDFVDAMGAQMPEFTAGAHIDVRLPDGIVRQYSLCNSPTDRTRYRIGVLREPNSRGGSVAMHALAEGATVSISEPRNHFPLQPEARHHVLLAGGIGITPLLCMAEHLVHVEGSFELHYLARSETRAAFRDRLQSSEMRSKVHLHFDDAISNRDFDLVSALEKALESDTHVYVCGPGGFMDFALASARRAGFSEPQLHREYFAASSAHVDDEQQAFHIRVASTGETYEVGSDETVVVTLARHNISIPVSCEQGVCGTCVTRVLEGRPLHRDVYMTDAEHARNDQFTPCCSRSLTPLLVLDL